MRNFLLKKFHRTLTGLAPASPQSKEALEIKLIKGMSHSTHGRTVREVPGRQLKADYVPPKERRPPTGSKITGEHGLAWERPEFKGGLKYPGGYTGAHLRPADPPHVLDEPLNRVACLGYTAFRPGKKDIIGSPIVSLASERGEGEAETYARSHQQGDGSSQKDMERASRESKYGEMREAWRNVDIEERYAQAKQTILDRGQSEEMLVQIVQSKFAARVNSYAEQIIKVKKLFESFDLNGDGVLDEEEFRICLEKLNIQLDDAQALTLFAYFDKARAGEIPWRDFQQEVMVANPKGGTACLPKQISMTTKYLQAS